jgi:hypothetical protein
MLQGTLQAEKLLNPKCLLQRRPVAVFCQAILSFWEGCNHTSPQAEALVIEPFAIIIGRNARSCFVLISTMPISKDNVDLTRIQARTYEPSSEFARR